MFRTVERSSRGSKLAVALAAAALLGCATLSAQGKSKPFTGAKVNQGTVSCSQRDGKLTLTLSDDFVVPDTPAPHWQLVDSRGNAYLLERLVTKGDVLHKSITVPGYVPDVAKVQIWCAWAEALLGETALDCSLAREASSSRQHSTGVFQGPKANKGFVTFEVQGGKRLLSLSKDFVVPDTPAPHWRLVDSRGRTYLLNRLLIKGDKLNATIEIPSWVPDVAKVQIWCAWAETVLGEASFKEVVM